MSDPRYSDQRNKDPRYSNLWNHNSMLRSERIEGGGVVGLSVIVLIAIACIAGIYFNPERNSAKGPPAPIVDSVPTSPIVNRSISPSAHPVYAPPRQ